MSVELLLLHDHASSLRDIIRSAGSATLPSSKAVSVPPGSCGNIGKGGEVPVAPDTAADLTAARDFTNNNGSAPNQSPLMPPPALMLPSASFPCLSRLLKARGAAAPSSAHTLEGRHDTKPQRSRSMAAILQDGRRIGYGDHIESGLGQTTRTRARARPRSAGVVRRRPGSPSPVVALGDGAASPVPEQRGGGHVIMANTLSDHGERKDSVRPWGARIRPVSAPGRRPGTQSGHGQLIGIIKQKSPHQFKGPVTVHAEGGGFVGAGREQRALLGGWSAQDTVDRNAGELSRGGLLRLVRALREELRAADGSRVIVRHEVGAENNMCFHDADDYLATLGHLD